MSIELTNIKKSFEGADGNEIVVLDGIDVELEDNSFTTIMGPSGCGKSTLLNIISGLVTMDSGSIRRDGTEIEQGDLPYAYVFQEPRLLNWRTVKENITFALKSKGVPKEEHDERVTKYLEMNELAGEEESYPLRLSGGMRQRVGLARALAVEQDILLMDEPFSALDEITAQKLRSDVVELWQETEKTIVFVTHNISEAVFLSDQILFMNTNGEIFSRTDVDVDRPRSQKDEALMEIEATLLEEFYAETEPDQ